MDSKTREQVKKTIYGVMGNLIDRLCETTEEYSEDIQLTKPFGARLAPMEVWIGSKFERSLVTSLGQSVFEALGRIIAEGTGARAENQYHSILRICSFRLEKIDSILKAQRENRSNPNWDHEIREILSLNNERYEDVSVISDLFIARKDGQKEYYSLKTVKPNLDQTELAKRDMFRLVAGGPDNEVYFGLPYNPAGEGALYSKAKHTIPYKLFRMDEDKCVLIGSKMWNKIGSDPNTYEELLDIFEEVGKEYIPLIKDRYFRIM